MQVEGRCHCGAIRYQAEVEPGSIGLCHCLDCQMLSGSPFRALILAPANSFRLLTGAPRRYVKTADSGSKRVHAFCEQCGSPVYSCAVANPQTYSLRIGALKQRTELGRPRQESWTARRLPWISPQETASEFEWQP